ncbi:MAG: ascorbate-dependent monooxygenase [Gemmataceae bacterium]
MKKHYLFTVLLTITTGSTAYASQVTYCKDVAPILFQHCARCHRPGEVAPFSLLSYKDAAKRANFLVEVTQNKRMPPWKAERGHIQFRDERGLSNEELDVLVRWAKAGAPKGDPKDMPAIPKFKKGWVLGQPDLILRMPEPFTIPADGPDVYRCFAIPTGLKEDRTVAAVEFHPGNRRVVHHSVFFLDKSGIGRERDKQEKGPGYTSFGGPGVPAIGILGGWAPGVSPRRWPGNVGWWLPGGADLILQMHYHPTGKVEKDQSEVGIYFTKKKGKALLPFTIGTRHIDIPAGKNDYKITTHATLPTDVTVYGTFPHMHLIGRKIELLAKLPGEAKKKVLVRIPDWDFDWQDQYIFQKPFKLPKGTKLTINAVYDNSDNNPFNPNSPPKRVTFGEQTSDEMCLVPMVVVPEKQEGYYSIIQYVLFRRMIGEGLIPDSRRRPK